jgi:hypothetical protein
MAILYSGGRSGYTVAQKLPRQAWWRRVLGLKRPAGEAYVSFKFAFKAGQWHSADAHVHYPEGVDEIRLEITAYLDGERLYIGKDQTIAHKGGQSA